MWPLALGLFHLVYFQEALVSWYVSIQNYNFFKDFIYLFMREREREREAETQAEGEAGSMQGTGCGTRRVSRTTPWAAGGAKPLSHPGCPKAAILK